jgi:hypothetical protein
MKFPIKLVYVAGPISAPTPELREANVKMGDVMGLEVWRIGAVAVVPHLNSPTHYEGAVSVSDIYLGDLEILGRCDAMLRLPGWEKSRGVQYETAWANFLKIPIFDTLHQLAEWIHKK